ncbi:MAG TPA: prolyl oligopeptidase family serine peptidase [Nocardioidaceae bacterium]|nr:prolyl oligopeptidase family serine peptidase [Nocardioidaceae bacterium]
MLPPRTRTALTSLTVLAATCLAAPAAVAAPGDLPDSAPPAARFAEPRLPAADGWPFSERHFPRTSGTGRLHGGASYWTDFVYDDHGPSSLAGFSTPYATNLAPTQGVYTYPPGPAHANGADIFRTAVGLDERASYWRVDWTTLADPGLPMAVWTFDRDADADTGVADWPAGAGVRSPGIDTGLVVSGSGAWLVDLATGRSREVGDLGGSLRVDRAAQSFVVRLPRRALAPKDRWVVRVAAGLADDTGRSLTTPSMAAVMPAPGMTKLYNVGFRRIRQEPPVFRNGRTDALVAAFEEQAARTPALDQVGADGLARFVTGNFWAEDHQADALATGDVSAFATGVDWDRLAEGAATREPRPRGHSNRWYVSRLDLGDGVLTGQDHDLDLRPNFLGRVQPYSVYVPRGLPARRSKPLTWVLHSLGVNHNQYAALNPGLVQRLCESRGSVCAGILGRGPDGFYLDEAEVDFWSVWREVAEAFPLDVDRTQIAGYSMGGYAAYKLGLQHPDLYAGAISLAGPPTCPSGLDPERGAPLPRHERCEKDGPTGALVGNALHVPYRIAHGTLDQLVPFTAVEDQVARFDALGLRHRFVRYPGEDHMAFATQDRFDTVLAGLGRPRRARDPQRVGFSWFPHLDRPRLGLRATGAYWVIGVRARDTRPGSLARVQARTFARREPPGDRVRFGPDPVSEPLPAVVQGLRWRSAGATDDTRRLVTLRLGNVSAVTLDLGRAGLRCGRVRVATDQRATVRLVRTDGSVRRFDVPAGKRTLRLGC